MRGRSHPAPRTPYRSGHAKCTLPALEWRAQLRGTALNCADSPQALAFLAYLAESRGIHGPFLVVSPASTLPNWADEVMRFAPSLGLRPYWGAAADRAVLRKDFDAKKLGKESSPFHILVTSYQASCE